MKTKTLFAVILVILAAMTVAPEAFAQEEVTELEEITVTATKRETALEDTALALSVVTGDMVNEQGRSNIFDLLKDVPGLYMDNPWDGGILNIRGISGGVLQFGHGDPGVSTTVDGSYTSPLVSNPVSMGFYDIARVEVLRGPQGTLYGRNAEAGVLNVISNDPSDKLEGSGTIELGNFRLIRGSGMVNTPLTDNSALRIAFNLYDRKSYFTDGRGPNNVSGRVKYLYQPSDTLRFLVGGEFSKLEGSIAGNNVVAYGLGDFPAGDPYDNLTKDGGLTGVIPGSSGDNRYAKIWAQFDWETPIGNVTYLPSYSENESKSYNLKTGGVPDIFVTERGASKDHQTSFEARLTSSGDSAFDYVFGIFYLDAESSEWDIIKGEVSDDMRIVGQTSKAVFGQGTFDLTDSFRATLGLRYTRDTKNYYTEDTSFGVGGTGTGEKEWTRPDWKVGVEMDIFENGLLYADMATGYRPGTVNADASATTLDLEGNEVPYQNQFSKPEELLAYEIGAKSSFFNKRLTVNVDAYFDEYKDRQYDETFPGVPLTQLCPSGALPSERGSMIPGLGLCYAERNMGKVETYGGELSSVMRPTDNDTINLSVAYLKAYVAESQDVLVNFQGLRVDVKGETMPDSPKWQVNASYEHRFDFGPGSLLLRGDGRYTSKSYLIDFSYMDTGTKTEKYTDGSSRTYLVRDLYTCEAHTVYDFTATFLVGEGGHTISAYVKNVFDGYYKTHMDGIRGAISDPRTYGITFSAHF